ncbi:hypothetical protein K493DRAFT_286786 [Basidiobolus meristosporus CBS 931.73]|uniref:C2H2-type domain-containing protein n=1 Tax=Basidiobolus meristosporus CBS 931.73 TaxID=1314790 RepID=A0A1Y1Y0B8_9FUNG|nr:hypothetical protein K493DRAFT_286786 [Basidiobolus meristosporus CBS 931.73]|eukprot:ORX91462.1 hypothetical protein K493DRAFT_286786 [Basidiobolus meristosporus CBS 931.73]
MSGDRQERSVSRSRGEYLSDEENFYRGSREKFRRERRSSRERGYDRPRGERKDYSRSRSRSPINRERRYRRSPSPRRDRDRDRRIEADRDGDHYIPNYNRDGYVPAPRYGNNPEANGSQFGSGGNYSFGGPGSMMGEGAGGAFPRGRRGSRNQDYDDYYGDLDNPGGDPFYSDDFNGNPPGPGNAFMGNKPHSIDPNKLDTLVSFKHFSDWVNSQDPGARHHEDELERRYAIYKENFNVRQLNNFFEQHKNSDWFRERYHPKLSLERKNEIKQLKKKLYEQFVDDLNSGKYDDINLDDSRNTDATKGTEHKSDEKLESEESSESKPADPMANEENSNTLFIKSVPPSISREQVVKLCETVDGFSYLSLSEPNPQKKYHRLGWIVFKEGSNIQEAFEALNKSKIDEFQFHLALHKHQLTTRPRVAPHIANTPERLRHDEEKVRKLVDLLDQEAQEGFEGGRLVRERLAVIETQNENQMADGDDSELLPTKRSLDLHMEYLRKVHLFCYYCGIEADSLEEFTRKCVERHLRKTTPEPATNSATGKPNNNGQTWIKNLDKKIDMRLSDYSPTEIEKIGGKNPESELDKFTQKNVNKVDEGRYRCSLCNKLFKGEEFVKKHIGHKHPENFAEISEEVDYYNNYVRDPFHITLPSTTNAPGAIGAPGAPGGPGMPGFFPFMQPPNNFMSPGFGMNMPFIPQAAAVGTPMHQIPRIGFDTPRGRGAGGRVLFGSADRNKKTPGAPVDRLPVDPRQVKSYVDLDAPAEGDVDIHYG